MARTGISLRDVFGACTELKRAGEIPTIEKVRGILKTGSNSTISRYLNDWRRIGDPVTLNPKKDEQYIRGYNAAIDDIIVSFENFLQNLKKTSGRDC